MLRVPICVCLITGLAVSLGAGVEENSLSSVTVILDFKGPHSRTSVKEMQRESGLILKPSGVHLEWRLLGEDPSASYNDLVVITFKGSCEFQPAPPRYDELGPYAITRTSNGDVQPFGEVNCDRVVNSARTAMVGNDFAMADLLVGRALGRVVAHELVHMLTKSDQHGREGVEKAALSGKQLIASTLNLSTFDIDRLKQEHKGR